MGAQDKPTGDSNSLQRVKVYRLNEEGKWDDQGTGHVTVDYFERSEDMGLFVVDEEDNETLLSHHISSYDIYRKQEETIISWRDPDFATELALSFQETTGCSYIWQTVVESGITEQLRVIELVLHDQDFLRKLMELFRICEDLKNVDGLLLIFKIIRGINDPEVPHIRHRDFLKEHVVYKEAIPIKDPIVLSKIHQTYRVGYLKDVILPRALDDTIIANLNSIIHSNNATVVSMLRDNATFTTELFARLKSSETSIESKRTLVNNGPRLSVHFLHEFCILSRSLQTAHQLRLFRDLANEGIFDIIADVLQSEDKKLVLTATDIIILFLNQDLNVLRACVTRQEGVLFGLLVKNMLTDFGDDMHCQFLEILRNLLETYTPGSQRDTVVEIFYEKHFDGLVDVISSSCPPNGDGRIGFESVNSKGGSMHQNHDEHLMNHIVKNNLFKLIVDAFVANGDRYNLLNSAILELFEYIRKENLKILLRYLVDTFWDRLARFENLSSIRALKVKYEQSLESVDARSTGSLLDQRKRIDERALDKEEENYFKEGSSHGLVDYDDDDEDYRPPPKKLKDVSVEDEGVAQFCLNRKLASKDEPGLKRLRRSLKGLKPREGVFAALCSTLSQAVVPSKKVMVNATFSNSQSDANENIEPNVEDRSDSTSSSGDSQTSELRNHEEASPISCLNDSGDNRQHGDECLFLPSNSSPEMAVNGP
ncbi:hypothetical protein DH2020_020091 [Rehmannia glutinosa]|uniref:Serine/threonine-protein phosphatase 4 regulatory subunit 3-like central domain-containing protein n=1 Tax=Rehmannia glutinosa TaxID=99300 RepID=A0ABR0WF89_REHGL